VQAKRSRDFTTSDAIQAELESQGVDTQVARPDPRKAAVNNWGVGGGSGAGGDTYDPETEAKLDQWVQAKRSGDFTTSDAIQVELHAQGVNCDAARPDLKKGGAINWGAGRGTYDLATEAKLDQWVQAKRAKDFMTSDAIQAELEAQGVDTHAARPDPRKAGGGGGGAKSWDASGGSWDGGSFDMQGCMMNMMNTMKTMSTMKGGGGKGWGKERWGPY